MSARDRRGRLTADDRDTGTLTFRRVLRHRPEHVWDAISTAEGLKEWLMCTQALIEGRPGGNIELVSGPAGYRSKGKILRWEPPRVLEYEWNVAPVPEMPRGENAIFTFEVQPDGEDTVLLVTYRRITLATARGFLPGVHAFLDRLEAQLAGQPLPDWLQLFAELQGIYSEWTGHATSPAE